MQYYFTLFSSNVIKRTHSTYFSSATCKWFIPLPYMHHIQSLSQLVKSFLHQKPHRVHQGVLLQKFELWALTVTCLVLAWAVGYFKWHWIIVVCLVVAMVLIWNDMSKRIIMSTEQEVEVRLRRKKTVELSETAEWINLIINRWSVL